ncbi:MAG: FliM/FliN family flagellar motor switch protein [Phycisphaeraceae bacterium]|nr:FliM/FliN family flagellar motor switch protein [Phycisphaeraceae bacterium]
MPSDPHAILKLEVPIIVRLAETRMTVEQVLMLAPGAILELEKRADEDLDLMVNNRVIGAGHAVKVGENFGIRLSFVGDVSTRVAAATQPEDDDDIDSIAQGLLAGQL